MSSSSSIYQHLQQPKNFDKFLQSLRSTKHSALFKQKDAVVHFLFILFSIRFYETSFNTSISSVVRKVTRDNQTITEFCHNNPATIEQYMKYLCNIYNKRIKVGKHYTKVMFIGISRKKLIKLFGKKATDIINALKQLKIIETDSFYIPGTKCISYRLTKRYMFGQWEGVECTAKNKDMLTKLQTDVINDVTDSYLTSMQALNKSLRIFVPNFPWALWELRKLKEQKMGRYKGCYAPEHLNIDLKKNNIKADMTLINAGLCQYTIGKESQRVYSNFTSLPRETNKLFYDSITNRRLIQLDMSCFQCYLLGAISNLQTTDWEAFYDLCRAGKLYDSIATDLKLSREEIKEDILKAGLFGQEYPMWKPYIKEYIENTYPSVYAYINKHSSSELALKLQNAEANIIIGVSKQLVVDNIQHFTKHDAIFVDERHVELANALMRIACNDLYKTTPNIKESL
jgi:hypothetical protein